MDRLDVREANLASLPKANVGRTVPTDYIAFFIQRDDRLSPAIDIKRDAREVVPYDIVCCVIVHTLTAKNGTVSKPIQCRCVVYFSVLQFLRERSRQRR